MGLAAEIIRNLDTANEFNNISTNRIGQAIKYLRLVHDIDDGFITLAVKEEQKEWQQYHYKKEIIEDNIFKALGLDLDTYMSVNSFYVPKRSSECVRCINSLYVDIDDHTNNKVNMDSVLYFLEEDFFNREIPEPNLVIKTGRGLALYWILENLPKQGLPLWTLIQEQLYKKVKGIEDYIKDIAVDSATLDVSRVLRIPGSKNTKSNTLAKIYSYSNEKYRLDEIVQGYFPELEVIKENKKKNKTKLTNSQKKIVYFYSVYNLHYSRLMDIVKLQQLREGKCKGQRELICFLYRYYNCLYVKDYELAAQNTLEFNNNFKEPLSYAEVLKATKRAEEAYEEWLKNEPVVKNGRIYKRGGYNYTNKKLIELLQITPWEQKQLQTIISKEEKYKRNNIKRTPRNEKGLTMREQSKAEKVQAVKHLYNQGYKQCEIAEQLGVAKSLVSMYLKKVQ